jgi:two-component system, cell cycle sensor histidine kinase and response regulator CckA
MDDIPLPFWITEVEGGIQCVKRFPAKFPPDHLPAESRELAAKVHSQDLRQPSLRRIKTAADAGEVTEAIEPGLRPDGTVGEFLVYRFPIHNRGGERSIGGLAFDVTEQARAESELCQQNGVPQAVAQGITITDSTQANDPIIYANSGFLRLTGYELSEVLGKNSGFLTGARTDPVACAQAKDAIREGRPITTVLCSYRKDGTFFWNELAISPVFDTDGQLTKFVGVHTDVSQRIEMAQQQQHSKKMETIGQLTGGIAHDFNNLLTVIIAYCDLLLQSRAFEEQALQSLIEISKAGERAASLTRQLLAFSRDQLLIPEVVSLNAIIRDLETMLRRVIGDDIEVSVILQPELGHVLADPGQLAQVVLNLAVNARDAMPQGGKLGFETQDVELSEEYAKLHPGVVPGPYVTLAVTDTGVGMARETMHHIFEPYFTTKKPGMGVGLGLSVVQSVVTQCNGHIDVEGRLGVGTTFKICLPRTERAVTTHARSSARSGDLRGEESVLLVEDAAAVLQVSQRILENCGYTVLVAQDAESALAIAQDSDAPIDLLIADVVLPGNSGYWLAEQLQVKRPKMQVLFISGCLDDHMIRHGVDKDQVDFVAKPYSTSALAIKVREVLDR